eukprot:Lithocolla_globosa_v1_NODE_7914_length_888_cov_1.720288.p2 type:complete len:151 gc:universal NODE_7914_length_888_cov_1.720288:266-718(+)
MESRYCRAKITNRLAFFCTSSLFSSGETSISTCFFVVKILLQTGRRTEVRYSPATSFMYCSIALVTMELPRNNSVGSLVDSISPRIRFSSFGSAKLMVCQKRTNNRETTSRSSATSKRTRVVVMSSTSNAFTNSLYFNSGCTVTVLCSKR